MPSSPAPLDPFDERNQLRGLWPARIRTRLDACGPVSFESRCDRLARALGAADPVAIWALLMWNAAASPDLALRLRAWVRRGMPLPEDEPLPALPRSARAGDGQPNPERRT
ncbi:hypothetical protein [Azospirillum halopraeferens]|uniref:hypothetical protein n=1 Tax=Azospirillum halopraeferens TaxID=34010 RepID=UPI00041BCB86|nr:hypothetical protein [Azospirillum halopraeferens]